MNKEWLGIFLVFLVVELIGLGLGIKLLQASIIQPEAEATAGISFFITLLIATGFILLAIKFFPKFLKILELMAIFLGSEIFFEILLLGVPNAGIPAVILALLIVYLRLVYPNSIASQNLAMVTALLGIGPLLGSSLGIIPAWILMGALAIYDYISVFKTKHMVYMAKSIIKQNLALVAAIPTKGRVFHIGGGDLVMPIVLSVSIYGSEGLGPAVISLVFGLIGLFVVLYYLMKKKKGAFPALPPICLGMLVGYGIWHALALVGV